MALINNVSKLVSKSSGTITSSIVKGWQYLDPQFLNCFEIFIYPYPDPKNPAASFQSASLDVLFETTIAKFFIKSIDIPGFTSIEYVREDTYTRPNTITYVNNFSITFYETDQSVVRGFLKAWRNAIVTYQERFGYVFRDNQLAGVKNAIITPLNGMGVPNASFIDIKGMKLQSMGDVVFAQNSTEVLEITATFSTDRIDWF